jgi:hypothetical protein
MKFNNIINRLLREMHDESIAQTIPALDGQREVYVTTLLTKCDPSLEYADDEDDGIFDDNITPNGSSRCRVSADSDTRYVDGIERLGNGWGGASYWDADCLGEVVYTGKDFNNALNTYRDLIPPSTPDHVTQQALHQANKLKSVFGAFKVISIRNSGLEDFVFGVDVDVDAYNAAKQAADDLKDF